MDIPSAPGAVPNGGYSSQQASGGKEAKAKSAFQHAMKQGGAKQGAGENRTAQKRTSLEKNAGTSNTYQLASVAVMASGVAPVRGRSHSEDKERSSETDERGAGDEAGADHDREPINGVAQQEHAGEQEDTSTGVGDHHATATAFNSVNDVDTTSEASFAPHARGELSDVALRDALLVLRENWSEIRAELGAPITINKLVGSINDIESADLTEAIKVFKENDAAQRALKAGTHKAEDHENSGEIGLKKIDSLLTEIGGYDQKSGGVGIYNEADAIDALVANWSQLSAEGRRSASVLRDELKGLIENGDAPDALLATAEYYLNHAERLQSLGADDDTIDLASIAARSRARGIGEQERGNLAEFAQYWNDLRDGAEGVTLEALEKAAASEEIGKRAKRVAEYFRNHRAALLAVETAAGGSPSDDYISALSLYTRLEQAGVTEVKSSALALSSEREARKILLTNREAIGLGDAALASDSPPAAATGKIRAAAAYYKNHPERRGELLEASRLAGRVADSEPGNDVPDRGSAVDTSELHDALVALAEHWQAVSGDDGKVSPGEPKTASYLAQNPDAFLAVSGGDGKISAQEAYAGMERSGGLRGDNAERNAKRAPLARALDIGSEEKGKLAELAAHWDALRGDDQHVSVEELKAIPKGSDAYDVAQYFLANDSAKLALLALESASDQGGGKGIVRVADLYARLDEAGLKDKKYGGVEIPDKAAAFEALRRSASEVNGGDRKVSVSELKTITGDNPPAYATNELKAAAQYVIDNPDAFKEIADLQRLQGDTTVPTGTEVDNAKAVPGTNNDNGGLTLENGERAGLKTLAAHWRELNGGDGVVTLEELKRAGFTDLAAYLEENPDRFAAMRAHTSAGGEEGIAAEDLVSALQRAGLFSGNNAITAEELAGLASEFTFSEGDKSSLKALAQHWGELSKDGSVSLAKLKELAKDDTAAPDLRAAAEYLRDHPELRTVLAALAPASASANQLSANAVLAGLQQAKLLGSDNALPAKALAALSKDVTFNDGERAGLKTLAKHWRELSGGDSVVTVEELTEAGLTDLADYLQENPNRFAALRAQTNAGGEEGIAAEDLFSALHQAGLFSGDNAITAEELAGLAPELTFSEGAKSPLTALADHWSDLSQGGKLSLDKLNEIARDDTASPGLKAAAAHLRDHPALRTALAALAPENASAEQLSANAVLAGLDQAKRLGGDKAPSADALAALSKDLTFSDGERAGLKTLAGHWLKLSGEDSVVTLEELRKEGFTGIVPDPAFSKADESSLMTLVEHWGELSNSGSVSLERLEELAREDKATADAKAERDLKAAAAHLRDHAELRTRLAAYAPDSASADQLGARAVLAASVWANLLSGANALTKQALAPLAQDLTFSELDRRSVATIAEHGHELSQDDGYITPEEIDAIMHDPTAGQELKNAAQHLKQNPGLHLAVAALGPDAASGDKLTSTALFAALVKADLLDGENAHPREDVVTTMPGTPVEEDEKSLLIDTAKYWDDLRGEEQQVSRSELEAIRDGGHEDAAVRTTAAALLDHRAALFALQGAYYDDGKPVFSAADLYSRLERAGAYEQRFGGVEIPDRAEAMRTIDPYRGVIVGEGGSITVADLEAITDNFPPNYATNELKAASQFFLDNPEAFAGVA